MNEQKIKNLIHAIFCDIDNSYSELFPEDEGCDIFSDFVDFIQPCSVSSDFDEFIAQVTSSVYHYHTSKIKDEDADYLIEHLEEKLNFYRDKGYYIPIYSYYFSELDIDESEYFDDSDYSGYFLADRLVMEVIIRIKHGLPV